MVVANGGPRTAAGTLTQLFFDAVDRHDLPNALQYKVGGRYEAISHSVLAERVRHAARGLSLLGLEPGDRVAIISENRPEWVIADLACLTGRLIDVAVYPSLPATQIEYILRDSGAAAAFVSDAEQASKVATIRSKIPALKAVIGFDAASGADFTLAELERRGADGEPGNFAADHRALALAAQPSDLATLLYTSGTTGEPKGVMLTHDNIFSNVGSVSAILALGTDDTCLSFLPLSHIFERTVGYYFMLYNGVSIAYAESIDTIAANMLEVRPTLVVAVPRVYEKIYARVVESASASGVKRRIFDWSRRVGIEWAETRLAGRVVSRGLAVRYSIADRLVFAKLRARTGGKLRYFVSGSAPLAVEINKFFYAAGLVILEGYGLTETSPILTANVPGAIRPATVGTPMLGISIAIADDGEILARGPNIMAGYYHKPGETADAIDADGWFHTGDIGSVRDGFLSITDRKKDLIVTAGGKNIAPQPIENRIRANRYVAQAVMIGDRRKFPMVLVVPEFDQLERWASEHGLSWTSHAQLVELPQVQSMMENEVLGPLEDLAHFERPKKVALLARDFTIEAGELTPTLKVRRRAIDERYRVLIDEVYAAAARSAAA